jgi:hypothetical protein
VGIAIAALGFSHRLHLLQLWTPTIFNIFQQNL